MIIWQNTILKNNLYFQKIDYTYINIEDVYANKLGKFFLTRDRKKQYVFCLM